MQLNMEKTRRHVKMAKTRRQLFSSLVDRRACVTKCLIPTMAQSDNRVTTFLHTVVYCQAFNLSEHKYSNS